MISFESGCPVNRRDFLKGAGAVAAASVLPVNMVELAFGAGAGSESIHFAYISDSHLYEKSLNERFVRSILKAVDDVNALTPQPDFILYGGDLAQIGQPKELEEGAQIAATPQHKPPLRLIGHVTSSYFSAALGQRDRDTLEQQLDAPRPLRLRAELTGQRRVLLVDALARKLG